MNNSPLSNREKEIARKAYMIGQNDVFSELKWPVVFNIIRKAMGLEEDGPTPEIVQAAHTGVDPETTEGATEASE